VEEATTTTVVWAGQLASIDRFGLISTKSADDAPLALASGGAVGYNALESAVPAPCVSFRGRWRIRGGGFAG
jgi:hypothetical protein